MRNKEDSYTNHNKYNISRSDSYQYKIREIQVDPELFKRKLNTTKQTEQFKNLNDQAASRLFALVQQVASKRQFQVFKLSLDGYTQEEIADLLQVNNQSSIHKTLFGNNVYKDGQRTNHYGGLMVKMKTAILNDPIIKQILFLMIDANDSDNKHEDQINYPITIQVSNINIFYLISTYFKSQQAFHIWISS